MITDYQNVWRYNRDMTTSIHSMHISDLLPTLTPGAQVHWLFDILEAMEAKSDALKYEIVDDASSGRQMLDISVSGIQISSSYWPPLRDGTTAEQQVQRQIDDVKKDVSERLFDLCEPAEFGWKAKWLQVSATSF